MIAAFRLVKEHRADGVFDGAGSAKFGGRWNSPGIRVAYTSWSRSLAALETLVHIDREIPFRWVMFLCEFPESLVESVPADGLPINWTKSPAPPATREIGDRWAREIRSPVLRVPSVLVVQEFNYLLNPLHPAFGEIRQFPGESFFFDRRLAGG